MADSLTFRLFNPFDSLTFPLQEKLAMDAKQLRLTFPCGAIGAVGLCVGFVWTLILAAPAARADVRDSVKRALPATVFVDWHDAAVKAQAANRIVPPTPANDADSYKSAVRALVTQRKTLADRVNMASGTIVSADGLIVTMVGAREDGKYSVTLGDGRALAAQLLVDDRRTGLKLLKVDAAGLPFLMPANQSPQVGEDVTWTYCLGSKERAAGRGIIAATGRDLPGMGSDLLQLDVAVATGSAGAPLVDDQGRLLGIIAFSRADSQRISFAFPASVVQTLLAARRGDGPTIVQRGFLGIALSRNDADSPVVAHPTPDSPAAAAGVRDGDIVLAIDGAKGGSPEEIAGLIHKYTAGQKVKVLIRREGTEQEIEVTLKAAPVAAPPVPAGGSSSSTTGGGSSSASSSGGAPGAAAPLPKPPGVSAVRPDSLYIVDAEGKLQALPVPAEYSEQFRQYYDALSKTPQAPAVAVPSIQIQRSNMEKKLEAIGRDVLTLRQQMEKLTEEMQRLQKQLSGGAPKQ